MPINLSELHFPNAPNIIVEPPGLKARELLKKQAELEGKPILYPHSIPLVPEEGKGATLKDVDGNIYIDLYAGIAVLNVGHSNPYVLNTVFEQERKLIHALDFPTKPRIELTRKLREIAPGNLKKHCKITFGGPTGSDAIEGAIKLAKYATGRHGVIVFEGCYHGQTSASLALSSTNKFKERYVPLISEVHFLPYAYCYRCVFKMEYPDCSLACVDYVKRVIENPSSGVVKPAAILVEPIQGEGGIIVPPKGFLEGLRKICDENDVLLIIDEIQAGLGRTGKMFACEHWNVTPDIMTIAKAIGGVGLPLAACIYHERLDIWEPGSHVGTFRGHVSAMAAGLAAIKFMEEYKLLEHATKIGEFMIRYLKELAEESRYIGDIRGKGLMIGVEFVKNKENKEPYKDIVSEIQLECFKSGIIVWKGGHYANVIRFLPPLVITEELAEKSMEIFSETVKKVERKHS